MSQLYMGYLVLVISVVLFLLYKNSNGNSNNGSGNGYMRGLLLLREEYSIFHKNNSW